MRKCENPTCNNDLDEVYKDLSPYRRKIKKYCRNKKCIDYYRSETGKISSKALIESGYYKTIESKANLSKAGKSGSHENKIKAGKLSQKIHGTNLSKYKYGGFSFDSQLEIDFAKKCDFYNKKWKRLHPRSMVHHSDFYLPEYNIYVEIKVGEFQKNVYQKNNIGVICLIKSDFDLFLHGLSYE